MRQISRMIGRPLASFEKKISDDITTETGHGFQPFASICSKYIKSEGCHVCSVQKWDSADVLTYDWS